MDKFLLLILKLINEIISFIHIRLKFFAVSYEVKRHTKIATMPYGTDAIDQINGVARQKLAYVHCSCASPLIKDGTRVERKRSSLYKLFSLHLSRIEFAYKNFLNRLYMFP